MMLLFWMSQLVATAAPPQSAEEALARFSHEPSVGMVQQMAARYARLEPAVVAGWMQASKSAYLLPKVNLSYEKQRDAADDFFYAPGARRPELEGTRMEDDDRYGVKLEWRLDKLVMSSEQIRVINEAQDLVRLRDQVLGEVTRLYFERRRLQVDLLFESDPGGIDVLDRQLLLEELTGRIDAMTGGAFSAALASTEGR